MQLAGKSLQTADWGLVQFRHCASLERLSQGQEMQNAKGGILGAASFASCYCY